MEIEIGRGKKARRAYGFDDVAIVPSRRTRDPDDVDWAMLQLSDATIMLNTAYAPEEVPVEPDAARWSGHQDTCLYFGCPDLDGAYQQLVLKGLQLDPPKTAWYGMKQLYLKDPDGFGICFQWFA